MSMRAHNVQVAGSHFRREAGLYVTTTSGSCSGFYSHTVSQGLLSFTIGSFNVLASYIMIVLGKPACEKVRSVSITGIVKGASIPMNEAYLNTGLQLKSKKNKLIYT